MINIAQLDALPLHTVEIKAISSNNPILNKVMGYLKRGWPDRVGESAAILEEAKRANGGGRVHSVGFESCDPENVKRESLGRAESRTSRGGKDESSSTKPCQVAKLDEAIEEKAKSCSACQANRQQPPKALLHCWTWPSSPWECVHVDYAGPVMGKCCWWL